MSKTNTQLALLSRQRSFIMGIAILWVAWFHTDLTVSVPGISFIREVGYGGVDLFFFLSGIGAWFSLRKNPDSFSYMKNRVKRILPSYYPFIILWIVLMKFTGEIYGTEIIGNLTMMGWWSDSRCQFNWYTNAIWLFYLLAPVVVGMVVKSERKVLMVLMLMMIGFFASMTFWHTLLLTAFSRLPLFVLGVYFGSEMTELHTPGTESKVASGRFIWQRYPLVFWNVLMVLGITVLYVCLTFLSGYMWNYGLWWYPFVFISPGLALDLAWFAEQMKKTGSGRFFCKGIDEIGNASFEVFLWHIGIFEVVKPRYEMNALLWLVLMIIVFIWSVIYRKVIQKIVKYVSGTLTCSLK